MVGTTLSDWDTASVTSMETMFQGAAAFKRISNVIDKKIQIIEKKDNSDLIIKNSQIKFKNVGFKYEATDEKAVKNIDLNFIIIFNLLV